MSNTTPIPPVIWNKRDECQLSGIEWIRIQLPVVENINSFERIFICTMYNNANLRVFNASAFQPPVRPISLIKYLRQQREQLQFIVQKLKLIFKVYENQNRVTNPLQCSIAAPLTRGSEQMFVVKGQRRERSRARTQHSQVNPGQYEITSAFTTLINNARTSLFCLLFVNIGRVVGSLPHYRQNQ